MKKMEMKYIAMFAIPHACIIFFSLVMILSKLAIPYISSFDVDSKGRVYVGENEGVCIYQDRDKIGSIAIQGETYFVDVDESDNICVVYPSRVDWMDSCGNIVKTIDDPNANTYAKLSGEEKTIVAVNGDTYKIIGQYGWTRIVKNNSEIVYCQSVLSFAVKMLIQICTVSMFVSGIWVVYRVRKMKTTQSV